MRQPGYFLHRSAFVCRAGDYWVFLNVERDKYQCITQQNALHIAPWIYGLAPNESQTPNLSQSPEAKQLIDDLVARGLLTEDQRKGKSFSGTIYDKPTSSLVDEGIHPASESHSGSFMKFLTASVVADWRLRARPLQKTLARIKYLRERGCKNPLRFDASYAEAVLREFRAYRPRYPRRYLCIYDSMALLHFFARFGPLPHFVFGVIPEPFNAHCWLQEGPLVIDDELESVSHFTPVMVA